MNEPGLRVSRAFGTRWEDSDEPVWGPLEAVARLSRESPELPSFHPGEFMYMYRVVAKNKKGLRIHLYKHIDTRCYLNLDDNSHAYMYCGGEDADPEWGGRYRLHRTLLEAVERLDFSAFELDPPLHRSFPPQKWPRDEAR